MSAGSTHRGLTRVLVAGDQEADPRVVNLDGDYEVRNAQGVRVAVSALREEEFAVVVADVVAINDAMAILRAAARGRPPSRSIVLLPADSAGSSPGAALVRASAFATLRHPLGDGALQRAVAEAAAAYHVERTSPVVQWRGRTSPEEREWRQAERAMTEAIYATVVECLRFQRSDDSGAGVEQLVRGMAAAAVEAAQSRYADPAVLAAIAGALSSGVHATALHREGVA
jgi:DNA-binding NtrC family response regulator